MTNELEARIAEGFDARDRDNMGPTIDYFRALLDEYPGNADVLYEVAGSYDTAGDEATAETFYIAAFAAGLTGERRRRAFLQYGSTLRNLGRIDESLAMFVEARSEYPESDSLRIFHALSMHAAGHGSAAFAEMLRLVAERVDTPEIARYRPAIEGNAEYLASLDS